MRSKALSQLVLLSTSPTSELTNLGRWSGTLPSLSQDSHSWSGMAFLPADLWGDSESSTQHSRQQLSTEKSDMWADTQLPAWFYLLLFTQRIGRSSHFSLQFALCFYSMVVGSQIYLGYTEMYRGKSIFILCYSCSSWTYWTMRKG